MHPAHRETYPRSIHTWAVSLTRSPAGTLTQAYEDELLKGYGAEAKPEVFIVTSRTMVAINHHRLTVLREPSQQVSPG